jgi:hypothetical protein
VKVVLVIIVTPATYHGTKTVSNDATTNGTIHADDGSSASYSGTTTSSTQVPYSFDYGKYQLTVETAGPNHTWIAHHRFAQDGIYQTMYGIPLGGRGHHPAKALIEDAVKWLSKGGLNDPLQGTE